MHSALTLCRPASSLKTPPSRSQRGSAPLSSHPPHLFSNLVQRKLKMIPSTRRKPGDPRRTAASSHFSPDSSLLSWEGSQGGAAIGGGWDEGFPTEPRWRNQVGGAAGEEADPRPGARSAPERVHGVVPDPPLLREVGALRQDGGALVAEHQAGNPLVPARACACVCMCVELGRQCVCF